jgi:hypothetical protein
MSWVNINIIVQEGPRQIFQGVDVTEAMDKENELLFSKIITKKQLFNTIHTLTYQFIHSYMYTHHMSIKFYLLE